MRSEVQPKEHINKESHSNLVEEQTIDEDIDVILDEERLERLQTEVDAGECV